jgi:hypothetical protein
MLEYKKQDKDLSDSYFKKLGILVNNLQTLEFWLRNYLITIEEKTGTQRGALEHFNEWKEGKLVEICAFTDDRSLSQLITEYNNWQTRLSSGSLIDNSIAEVRDSIAHGRVFIEECPERTKLIRFNKPKGDFVRIRSCIVLTEKWFDDQTDLIVKAILDIDHTIRKLKDDV